MYNFNCKVYYMNFDQKNTKNVNMPSMLMFASCSLHFSFVFFIT